ncbi:MAG: NRDE family protein [Phycisphaerales bacterium]
MCTLSIIETSGGGYRVVHSRDEQRSRGRAYPPTTRTLESGLKIEHPTDLDAGGTWIVAAETGVTAGVLNYQTNGAVNPNPRQSRGLIPLHLIHEDHPASMLNALRTMDLAAYACFTAFGIEAAADGPRLMVAQWNAEELIVVRDGTETFEPIIIASSGLGDEIVQDRVPLFEEMVAPNQTPEIQDAFHMHHWDDKPEASVLMSRENARTVSITTIEVDSLNSGAESGQSKPIMTYQELPENDPVCDPVGAGMLQ